MAHNPPRIDLFSDTKTRPSMEMRKAMCAAEVGDEQADEDPTTISLCEIVADLLGHEKALFLPSGTMCNQIALAVHCNPGDEIIADKTSHIFNFEVGGASAIAGAMIRPIEGKNGIFAASQVEDALRPPLRHSPKSRVVVVEQTSNLGGGSVWTLEMLNSIKDIARNSDLIVHMDGARLMNAVVASGISAKDYASCTDTAWIDLSKGLGCPIGGVLTGTRAFIEEAWFWKQRLGGAMRQSGMMAAAGIFALKNNVSRLAEDHENAQVFVERLSQIDGIELKSENIETNIIFFTVNTLNINAVQLSSSLLDQGIRINVTGENSVRAVTHMDVDRKSVIEAADAIGQILVRNTS